MFRFSLDEWVWARSLYLNLVVGLHSFLICKQARDQGGKFCLLMTLMSNDYEHEFDTLIKSSLL